jgi:hypothetical protein
MDDLDGSYTKLQNLVDVFEEWHKTNPDEYRQCFANLSLGDLASVLVQADLCALNDPWNESDGYNEAKWVTVAHSATEALEQAGLARIVEKAVVPAIMDLFARSGYNLMSSRQTRSLSAFYLHVQKLFPKDSAILTKLREQVIRYIQEQLQDISVAIVVNPLTLPSEENMELREVMRAATVGQMHRLEKILRNLLMHWAPILQVDDDFVGMVLDFISSKFLFLLSSLHSVEGGLFTATPADVFGGVWNCLKATGWLERPEWMIQAAPLHASAIAYKLD